MIHITSSGNFNRTSDGIPYLFDNGLKYRLRKQSLVMHSTSAWIYGNTPGKLTNNDFTSALDFNLYKTFPNFYYRGLINFTPSFSLKVKEQLQTVLGMTYRVITGTI